MHVELYFIVLYFTINFIVKFSFFQVLKISKNYWRQSPTLILKVSKNFILHILVSTHQGVTLKQIPYIEPGGVGEKNI